MADADAGRGVQLVTENDILITIQFNHGYIISEHVYTLNQQNRNLNKLMLTHVQ